MRLGIPSPLVPLLAVLFGVYVLPETYSFEFFWVWLCFRIVRFWARQRIQFMCQSSVAFGCYFTHIRVKGGPRIAA